MTDRVLKYDFVPNLENPSNVHHIEFEMIPSGSSVLDIGCHTGILGAALIARKAATVVGLDTDADALDVARTRLSSAHLVDIEVPGWAQDLQRLGHTGFDVILFGDVLEHTKDPSSILRSARKLLKPGGRIVVSIPNVAHWRIRIGLLRGNFTYTDSGILDRTHLHFYTRATGRALIKDSGYAIVESAVAGYSLPHWLIRRLPGLLAIQLVFAATPA